MVLEVYGLDAEFSRVLGTWYLIMCDGSFIDDFIFFIFFLEKHTFES